MSDSRIRTLPRTYQEQQTELYLLAQFISEKQEWLSDVTTRLGWSSDLVETQSRLLQCVHDSRHHVPEEKMSQHVQRCQYVAAGLDNEMRKSFEESPSFTYPEYSSVVQVTVDTATQHAISEYVQQQQKHTIDTMRSHHMPNETLESLESEEDPPSVVQIGNPIVFIRYIKSWKKIPKQFAVIDTSSLNPVEVKSWLFKNLPDRHAYSDQVGGEIHAVNAIMNSLKVVHTTSPDTVMEKLHPLLQLGVRSFVLSLWKFLTITKVQHSQSIPDTTVSELLPLPIAGQPEDTESALVSEIRKLASSTEEISLPAMPVNHAHSYMKTEEIKTTYDYVVEVSRNVSGAKKDCLTDPNLTRDDSKRQPLQDESKEEDIDEEETRHHSGGNKRSYLEQLKDLRDYKRRRQSYRAKNVHITRRTPVQIFRDIIQLRMTEMGVEDNAEDQHVEMDSVQEVKEKSTSNNREQMLQHKDRWDRADSHADQYTCSRKRSHRRSSSKDRDQAHKRSHFHSKHKRSRSRSCEHHHKHKHKSKKSTNQ